MYTTTLNFPSIKINNNNNDNPNRSETDCFAWSKQKLTSLLSDLTLVDEPSMGIGKTGTVDNVSGECTANIRKGKTIFFYELEVKVLWEGIHFIYVIY